MLHAKIVKKYSMDERQRPSTLQGGNIDVEGKVDALAEAIGKAALQDSGGECESKPDPLAENSSQPDTRDNQTQRTSETKP